MGIPEDTVDLDHPFPAWSLTLPAPVPFPRAPFRSALDEHVRLFGKNKLKLLRALRNASMSADEQIDLPDLSCFLEASKGADDVIRVASRGKIADLFRNWRGLLHPLLTRPVGPHTFLVVATRGILSLHLVKVGGSFEKQQFHLTIAHRELAFEPTAIKHRVSGYGAPVTVTEWQHPDGEPRYAWTRIPPEPATDDEAIDRWLARDEPKIRAAAAAFASKHPGQLSVALATFTRERGEGMEVDQRSHVENLPLPQIVRLVTASSDPSLLPVVVMLGVTAGLRWLSTKGDDRALPPSMVEKVTFPPDEHAKPYFTPADEILQTREPEAPPKRKLSDAELIAVIQSWGVTDEIDVHLAQMTNEEIDRDIAAVGLDPAMEHATPWLRESVIESLSKLERDDSRFFDEKGNLRLR